MRETKAKRTYTEEQVTHVVEQVFWLGHAMGRVTGKDKEMLLNMLNAVLLGIEMGSRQAPAPAPEQGQG